MLTILALGLDFMIAVTYLAVQVILWQSADISVSIVSEETIEGSNEVTISVLNTAGSTLLFHENTDLTGRLEFLTTEGWVKYCDISYTNGNVSAISQKYGGTFAELSPGEDWEVSVPADMIEGMENGTYRIVMTYVTEDKYNEYIDSEYKNKDVLSESDESVSKVPQNGLKPMNNANIKNPKEKFLAQSISEVFIKTFEFESAEKFVKAISIADEHID